MSNTSTNPEVQKFLDQIQALEGVRDRLRSELEQLGKDYADLLKENEKLKETQRKFGHELMDQKDALEKRYEERVADWKLALKERDEFRAQVNALKKK